MPEAVISRNSWVETHANSMLNMAARTWFLAAATGQWIFAIYIAAFYGPKLILGGLAGLQDTHLANGFIAGDTLGNSLVAAHVMLAVIIMACGPLQLIPQIRTRFPAVHHWVGRSHMLAAVISSIGGLYLIWTRPLFGSLASNIGTSTDGLLVLGFAAMALRFAVARDIRNHRRWALRLFMVAAGVWFLRIQLNAWTFFMGSTGIDFKTFSGPFIDINAFAQFLLPLAVLELYFFARERSGARGKMAMAAGLFALTVLMGVGIYATSTNMWLPRM